MEDFITSSKAGGPSLPPKGFEEGPAGVAMGVGQMYGGPTQTLGDGLSTYKEPVFSIGRVDYNLPAPLIDLSCTSNILFLALGSLSPTLVPRIVRIDLSRPEEDETIDVPLSGFPPPNQKNQPRDTPLPAIQRQFVDPTGRHLVIVGTNGEVFYLYDGWPRDPNTTRKRMRPLSKLKGLGIESIAWQSGAPSSSTREILLGTSSGRIYETCIDGELESSRPFGRTAHDRYLRSVVTVPDKQAIQGLHFELWLTRGDARRRAVIIATTSTRIYQYVGPISGGTTAAGDGSDGIFESLSAQFRETAPKSLELPGELPHSELHFWQSLSGSILSPPKTLAWLTGPGIYHGQLSYSSQEPGDGVIDSAQLLPYPARPTEPSPFNVSPSQEQVVAELPLSMALTEYHFVLLYSDRLRVIRALDDKIVFEETLDMARNEKVFAITADPYRRTYWLYSASSIFELTVRDEDRDIWAVYLERQAFDQALKFAKTPRQTDLILTRKADAFFAQGRSVQSAELYAQTSKSFEEIVLKFVDRNERDALRNYLHSKLARLKKTELTQRMMLATWLVEIFLSKLNHLEGVAAAEGGSEDAENFRTERSIIEDDFREFLRMYKDNLDSRTVFNLLSSHGRIQLLLYYAEVVGDFERILSHWIFEHDWTKAIDALNRQEDLDLYYRHAPTLLRRAPGPTVDALLRQRNLDVRRLIPALLQIRPISASAREHFIRYLRYCVLDLHNSDAAIHNALINLLATSESPDEQDLLHFLSLSPDDPSSGRPYYDLDYALRLCKANGRLQSCVQIYSKMGLYSSSVELALENGDIELAKINADKPEDDETLRKRLWLKIARHVVGDKHDIKTAVQFLETTDLIKIEDILPFFPDFTIIDEFKDGICSALEDYAARIEQLKTDMDEANLNADAIKEDIADLSNRFVVVDAADKCASCALPLLTRHFYVFPCLHSFHADCLITEVTQHLSPRALRRVLDLQSQLSREALNVADSAPIAKTQSESGFLEPGTRAKLAAALAGPAVAGVQSLAVAGQGLDQLRKLVIPDALVSVIGGSILGSRGQDREGDAKEGLPTSTQSKNRKMDRLREELDDLLAKSCVLCHLAIASLDLPFVADGEKDV